MENQLNLYVLQPKYTNEGKNPVTDMTHCTDNTNANSIYTHMIDQNKMQ